MLLPWKIRWCPKVRSLVYCNFRSTMIGAEITLAPCWAPNLLFWANNQFQFQVPPLISLKEPSMPHLRISRWYISLQQDGPHLLQQQEHHHHHLSPCQCSSTTTPTCHLGPCLLNQSLEWCQCRPRLAYLSQQQCPHTAIDQLQQQQHHHHHHLSD